MAVVPAWTVQFLTARRENPSASTTPLMILFDAPRILRTSALILPSSLHCQGLAKNHKPRTRSTLTYTVREECADAVGAEGHAIVPEGGERG